MELTYPAMSYSRLQLSFATLNLVVGESSAPTWTSLQSRLFRPTSTTTLLIWGPGEVAIWILTWGVNRHFIPVWWSSDLELGFLHPRLIISVPCKAAHTFALPNWQQYWCTCSLTSSWYSSFDQINGKRDMDGSGTSLLKLNNSRIYLI